jgi:hypothetical protein
LWDARKEVDSVLEEQFGKGVFDPEKYSVFQRAVTDMLRTTNEFINEGTDDTFKQSMRLLSDMYEARSRIAIELPARELERVLALGSEQPKEKRRDVADYRRRGSYRRI